MIANVDRRYEKLEALPPQRCAELEDFFEFQICEEAHAAALGRFLASAPALKPTRLPPMTE